MIVEESHFKQSVALLLTRVGLMLSVEIKDLGENSEQMTFSTCDLALMHLQEAARLGAKVPGFREQQLFSYILGMCVELLLPLQIAQRMPDGGRTR